MAQFQQLLEPPLLLLENISGKNSRWKRLPGQSKALASIGFSGLYTQPFTEVRDDA